MRRLKAFFDLIAGFRRDRSGATAIEYAMIAGGIALVIIAAVRLVGTETAANFQSASDAFK